MRKIGLQVMLMSAFLSTSAYAHMYDSVGVQAGDHTHDPSPMDDQIKENCFIDPKLGPICK